MQFSPPSFEIRDTTPVPAGYNDLCRHWILEIVVDLGGHERALREGYVSEPQMLGFLGLEVNRPDREYSQPEALPALEALHRKAVTSHVAWVRDRAEAYRLDRNCPDCS